jgi:RNA polymerase sigma factor (TIGR02999 family)
MTGETEFTNWLIGWQHGDAAARDALVPHLYEELRRLARRAMSSESPGHTLQTTALVHEAYLRLVQAPLEFSGRQHFCALAARMMRRILVDHARSRHRLKRGGGQMQVSLTEAEGIPVDQGADILILDEALDRLAGKDERMAQAVELVYFGGLSYEQTAAELGISRSTLGDDLKFARAWLRSEMTPE